MDKVIDEKLIKFIFVGIINTMLGMAIMYGLYNIWDCSYWMSSAANYAIVSVLSYILNKRYTFVYRGDRAGSAVRFIGNIAVCYFIAYGVSKPVAMWILNESQIYFQENIAMFIGMCIFTGLNYLGQRFFVFGGEQMKYENNYSKWLRSKHISCDDKQKLKKMNADERQDAFYKTLEFGTAGMRGKMGIGTNRMNRYIVRMAAKGLAELLGEGSKVAIAYDTRNNSREFAEESARVLAAHSIKTMVFDRYSPVPLLSFAVRELKCDGGIVITASHNTKEYNGFKVYDSTGCQMNTELCSRIAQYIEKMNDYLDIPVVDMDNENINYIGEEIVEAFLKMAGESFKCTKAEQHAEHEEKCLKIVYTPLHGSGRDYVLKILKDAGFENISLVKEQAEFDGNFPTVTKPNPEEHDALAIAGERLITEGGDIAIGTDPDCDRIGVGVRHGDKVIYLSGNQMGALLIDYLARIRDAEGKILVTTIVTGELGPLVASKNGIKVEKTLTGFKYIGSLMNKMVSKDFFMGYEESYGYLVGDHVRDKDAISAALAICEMSEYYKGLGQTLIDRLKYLYEEYGFWEDKQESFVFEGETGEREMEERINMLKNKGVNAFPEIGQAIEFIDYNKGIDGLPSANVLKYIFDDGSWIAVRPSGTEPKIKLYYWMKK